MRSFSSAVVASAVAPVGASAVAPAVTLPTHHHPPTGLDAKPACRHISTTASLHGVTDEPAISTAPGLADEAVVAALRHASGPRQGWIGENSFRITDVLPAHDAVESRAVDIRVVDVRPGDSTPLHGWLRIPLPSSGAPQPWLYAATDDAEDWVDQLRVWVMEEVDTGGLTSARIREERDGRSFVVVEGYGWRVADLDEHARLSRLVGPKGWHGIRPPGRLARAWTHVARARNRLASRPTRPRFRLLLPRHRHRS